jgi:hypothetical protein
MSGHGATLADRANRPPWGVLVGGLVSWLLAAIGYLLYSADIEHRAIIGWDWIWSGAIALLVGALGAFAFWFVVGLIAVLWISVVEPRWPAAQAWRLQRAHRGPVSDTEHHADVNPRPEGDPEDTTHIKEARHWLNRYTSRVQTYEDMRRDASSEGAMAELVAEEAQAQARHLFWRRRVRELETLSRTEARTRIQTRGMRFRPGFRCLFWGAVGAGFIAAGVEVLVKLPHPSAAWGTSMVVLGLPLVYYAIHFATARVSVTSATVTVRSPLIGTRTVAIEDLTELRRIVETRGSFSSHQMSSQWDRYELRHRIAAAPATESATGVRRSIVERMIASYHDPGCFARFHNTIWRAADLRQLGHALGLRYVEVTSPDDDWTATYNAIGCLGSFAWTGLAVLAGYLSFVASGGR